MFAQARKMKAYTQKLILKGEKMMKMTSDIRDARMESSIRRRTTIHTTIQSPRNVDEDAFAIGRKEMNVDPSFEGRPQMSLTNSPIHLNHQ